MVHMQVFVGDKLSHKLCGHLFCHMLLCMEGVTNPTNVNKEAFTVALAHLLKATPSERACILCQLASGSPNCAKRTQLIEVSIRLFQCFALNFLLHKCAVIELNQP